MKSISIEQNQIELTIVMLGSNDCVDPLIEPNSNQAVPLQEFSQNLEDMYMIIKEHSRRTVFFTPPPTDQKLCPSRPFARMNGYRMAVIDFGRKHSIPVMDTWPLLLGKNCEYDQKALDSNLSDGLHLNYAGNKLLGEAVFEFVLKTYPELAPESLPMIPRHWSTVDNSKLPECLYYLSTFSGVK
jgi:lysophospholipase L1-like esterase